MLVVGVAAMAMINGAIWLGVFSSHESGAAGDMPVPPTAVETGSPTVPGLSPTIPGLRTVAVRLAASPATTPLGLAATPAPTPPGGAEASGPSRGEWALTALYVVTGILVVGVLVGPSVLERHLLAGPDAGSAAAAAVWAAQDTPPPAPRPEPTGGDTAGRVADETVGGPLAASLPPQRQAPPDVQHPPPQLQRVILMPAWQSSQSGTQAATDRDGADGTPAADTGTGDPTGESSDVTPTAISPADTVDDRKPVILLVKPARDED